jgi:hypothetical protein
MGVTDAGDVAILKDATSEMIVLGIAAWLQGANIVAAVGRRRAKGPITGVVKAPPPVDPPADLEGLF